MIASSQEIPNTARDRRLDVTFLLGKVGHSPELGAPWDGDTMGWGHGWPREGMGTRTPVFPSQLLYLQAKWLLASSKDEIIAGEMLGVGELGEELREQPRPLVRPATPSPSSRRLKSRKKINTRATDTKMLPTPGTPKTNIHTRGAAEEPPEALCCLLPSQACRYFGFFPARGNATATGS